MQRLLPISPWLCRSAIGQLRQFNRMQAVFHAMHSGIEQSVSGLSGRAAIGITICWMSGIGRGSRIDSRSRVTQISLLLLLAGCR